MHDLRNMAKAPMELFGTFVTQACSILTEEGLTAAAALEKFQHAREILGRDTEGLLKTFRLKLIQKEEELQAILRPPRRDLIGQAREAIRQLYQVVGRFSLRNKLTPTLQGQSLSAVLAAHQEALAKADTDAIELFEAEAERLLARKNEDLAEQALKAVFELARTITRFSLKEKLTRAWEDQPASALLAAYQEALAKADTDAIELFEAEAERLLARKGDPQALSAFATLRAQPLESRLTPAQREAKATLQELRRIKEEAALAMCLLASISKFHARLIPLCTQWRREVRHRLEGEGQRGISAALHTETHPQLPVILVDWSKSGLRVQCCAMFPPDTILVLSLQPSRVKEQALSLKGEVRWFQEEPNHPGRYTLGLRIVKGVETPWWERFPTLMEQSTQRDAL
ncbi:MAG: hypothetical protein ACE5IQ_06615 [Candidatus Methylomirabilales bacterium]